MCKAYWRVANKTVVSKVVVWEIEKSGSGYLKLNKI